MNYYEILEVSQKASPEVLKAAYKSLMQRYHPDRNPGNAEAAEHSVIIAQAYEVLSDSSRRAAYDVELKLQLGSLDNIRDMTRVKRASASLGDTKSEPHWFLWLLIASIVLFLWLFWLPSEKKQSSGFEPKNIGSLLGGYQSDLRQNKANEHTISLAARTIPVFIKDLNVNLEAPAKPTNVSQDNSEYVLSIQTIGIVAGTFDPDKFISFMENNKEYIGLKLAEKLVGAEYEKLIKPNGDHYLKQLILDAIGEITDTSRFEKSFLPGTKPLAHYGAVDVLLDNSFTVKLQHSGNVTVP